MHVRVISVDFDRFASILMNLMDFIRFSWNLIDFDEIRWILNEFNTVLMVWILVILGIQRVKQIKRPKRIK